MKKRLITFIIIISCVMFTKAQTSKKDTTSLELQGVTCTAANVIRKADRQIILPSKFQLKSSTNGLDLLENLHLSRVNVDLFNNKVTSSIPGDVQLRINGVKANIQQVMGLRPADIKKIEYHDDPGMRYGENVASVIDYITYRPTSGGYISTDLRESPFTGFGDDGLNMSFNNKRSQFGTNLWWDHRDLNGYWRVNTETFNFADGTSLTRKEQGYPTKLMNSNLWSNFYYNYQNDDKWFFNATLSLNDNFDKWPIVHSLLYPVSNPDNSVDMHDKSKNYGLYPSLDLYFQRNYSHDQHLVVDVVGTYMHTHNQRNYSESKNDSVITDINSDIKGKKYSIIAEAIYEKGLWKTNTLSVGERYYQAYADNNYWGTVNTVTSMQEGRSAAFAELKGKVKKFNYSAGSYLAYLWTQQGDDSYHKVVVYPKATLGYAFSDKAFLQYTGSLAYNTPNLSDLSNVEQVIDSLQIRRGNPNLKVSGYWSNNLYFEWSKGIFKSGLNLFYMYQDKPVMEETLRENDKFIRTNLNQRSWQKFNPELTLNVGPIKKILNVEFVGGMNYFDSKGVDYHHCYTNWYYHVQATANYKNLTAMFMMYSHENDFYGETLTYGENFHLLMLKYKYKNVNFGIGALNPFVGRNSYNRPTENWSKYAPSHNTWYLRDSSHLFFATFSWDISFGTKYNAKQKLLNNSDKDAGTMKSN